MRSKKYIIYLGGFRLPDGNASAQRAIANVKLFEELGYEVVFIAKPTQYINEKWFQFQGVRVYNIEYRNKFPTMDNKFLENELEINSSQIFAIIAYNYPGFKLNQIRKNCKKNNLKLISEVTEWYAFEMHKNLIFSIFRLIQTEFRMRYVNKRIGNIICSTKYCKNYYSKYNVLINPNVINTSDLKWLTNKNNILKDIRTFVYAGSPGKNMKKDRLDYIIKAFSKIDKNQYPYLLKIIGITKEQFLKTYPDYEMILQNMNDSITFFGRVSHMMVLDEVKKSDFSILFRLDNRVSRFGFATKISESISCGTPIVANDERREIRRYLVNEKHGLFFSEVSIDALENSILKAIKLDREAINHMKEECLGDNPFNYKNFEKDTRRFLEKLK